MIKAYDSDFDIGLDNRMVFQGVFPSVKGGQLEGQALNGLYSGESNHPVTLHTLNLKHSKYTDGYFTNIETVKE